MTEQEIELNEQGHARRRFLKQAAAVAWASPFIVTMMSRTAHAQQTCGTQGPDADPTTGALLCTVTAPCGTAGLICAPDPDDLGAGNPCLCQAAAPG